MKKNIKDSDYFLNKILPITVIVKFTWILVVVFHFYSKKYYNNYTNEIEEVFQSLEELFHIIYSILMGCILVYIFKHSGVICIDGRSQDYLFAFGALMVLGNIKKVFHMLHFEELYNFLTIIDYKKQD